MQSRASVAFFLALFAPSYSKQEKYATIVKKEVLKEKGRGMNERRMRKNLIKLAVFSICVILFLAVAGVTLAHVFAVTFSRTTEERMSEEVNDYKDRITKQIQRNFQELNTLAAFVGESGLYQRGDFGQLLLKADSQNDFMVFGFFDLQGNGYISSSIGNSAYQLSEVQPELQKVVSAAFQGKESVSDAFFGDVSRKNVLVLSVPVYREGEIVGALAASDAVEVFSESLGYKKVFSGRGTVHLVNSDGEFIIRADDAVVKENPISVLEEPYLSPDAVKNARAAMERLEKVEFAFEYNKQPYHGLLEPLEINGWYLFCVNSTDNVNKNVYMLAYAIGAFFAIIAVLCFTTVVLGYRAVKKNNEELKRLASIDELTGIYNVRRFTELAEEAIEKEEGYAIAAVNIRQFKFINEIFGKEQADHLLHYMAQILKNSIKDGEFACRESADYFYLFLRDTENGVLESRLRDMINRVVTMDNKGYSSYRLPIRCGVAVSVKGEDLQSTMTHAMFALAKTKEDRRTSLWIFDTALHEREQEDDYIERYASKALDNGEFKLFLQPKINLRDNSLSGAEALSRWIRNGGTMIYPGSFIPLFEKNGFCTELDMYVFEKVCQLLRQWIDAGYEPVPISVNQSKLTFYKADYVKRLCAILEKYHVPASLIIIEILESMSIDNAEELNQHLDELKAIGFRISMDDFGSGYSSLNTLARLRIDEVKLDRGFLMEAAGASGKNIRLIIEQIVQLSKKLSISTVIEGVETEADDKFVKQIGCDNGQGYFYSRPVPAEVFTREILPGLKNFVQESDS